MPSIVPIPRETRSNGWDRINNGYVDIFISYRGVITDIRIKGDYPAAVHPKYAIGRRIDDLSTWITPIIQIKYAIINTAATGAHINIALRIKGRIRIGMTARDRSRRKVILRLFALKTDRR